MEYDVNYSATSLYIVRKFVLANKQATKITYEADTKDSRIKLIQFAHSLNDIINEFSEFRMWQQLEFGYVICAPVTMHLIKLNILPH